MTKINYSEIYQPIGGFTMKPGDAANLRRDGWASY